MSLAVEHLDRAVVKRLGPVQVSHTRRATLQLAEAGNEKSAFQFQVNKVETLA